MSTADAVTTIIEALNEHEEQPRKQIAEIVEVLGADASLALLAETKQVQNTGGIEVRDGTRRRTDGGVFFSLAKSKLPKADRNRIFRVKVPKPEPAAEAPQNGAPKPPPPAPPVPQPKAEPRRPEQLNFPQHRQVVASQKAADAGGRRRVVEVEVLRHAPKPAAPTAPESVRSSPANARPAPAEPPPPPARPVRRIVTVAAPPKEEPPPSTPEAAKDRVRQLLRELSKGEQRKVLLDLLEDVGGLPKPEPRREPKAPPPPPPPPPSPKLDTSGKERVLAAVTEALGLTAGDLARVLYGDDSAGPKAKARAVIERYRRSRG